MTLVIREVPSLSNVGSVFRLLYTPDTHFPLKITTAPVVGVQKLDHSRGTL